MCACVNSLGFNVYTLKNGHDYLIISQVENVRNIYLRKEANSTLKRVIGPLKATYVSRLAIVFTKKLMIYADIS